MKSKYLYHLSFESVDDLTSFVNESYITPNDIAAIVMDTPGTLTLFYWGF